MDRTVRCATTTIGLFLLLAALASMLVACTRTPPEQRLREQISAMQAAIESRDARDFMQGVTDDFAGNAGMDRAALQQVIRAQVIANLRIGVTLGPAEVQLHEDGRRATVRFTAMATGGSGRMLPERGRVYDIETGWRDEDGQWRLYAAQWKPRL